MAIEFEIKLGKYKIIFICHKMTPAAQFINLTIPYFVVKTVPQ
jgi:hypothetical protein